MHRYYAYPHSLMSMPLKLYQVADVVLSFDKNGSTIYHKNRNYDEYQYSDEEKVVLKLKSVLT